MRSFEQGGKPQSLPCLSIGFFLFRETVGEAAKPGKLARSGLPSACVSACSGRGLEYLGGLGWKKKKSPALTFLPEQGDYLAIGDVDR